MSKYVHPHSAFKPVVNTSLPAKEAPKLTPGTLASLTAPSGSLTNMPSASYSSSMYRSKNYMPVTQRAPVARIESVDEFPSLGSTMRRPSTSTNATTPVEAPKSSFASLARDWAKKQQEEEEKKKQEEALEADKKRLQYKSDARLSREVHKGIHKLLIGNKQITQDEEENDHDLPPPDDYDYGTYDIAGEEEEEEDVEYDHTNNYRRNKNELSTF